MQIQTDKITLYFLLSHHMHYTAEELSDLKTKITRKTEAHLIVQGFFGDNSEEAAHTSVDSGCQDVNVFVVISLATHNQGNTGFPMILKGTENKR